MPIFRLPGRSPKLARVLRKPEAYPPETIAETVIAHCSRNYNKRPGELARFGPGERGATAAQRAAHLVAGGILRREYREEKIVTGAFQHAFDNLLIGYCRKGGVLRIKTESLIDEAMRSYLSARQFSAICPVKADRIAAYADAVSDLCFTIRAEDFVLQKSLAALFQQIFDNKCRSQVRTVTTKKYVSNTYYVDLVLSQLPPAAVEKLRQPPHAMYAFDLETISRADRDCFQWLYMRHCDDLSFSEMSETLNLSVKQVRGRLEKCIEKFRLLFDEKIK